MVYEFYLNRKEKKKTTLKKKKTAPGYLTGLVRNDKKLQRA